jgi:hypothetical protein
VILASSATGSRSFYAAATVFLIILIL